MRPLVGGSGGRRLRATCGASAVEIDKAIVASLSHRGVALVFRAQRVALKVHAGFFHFQHIILRSVVVDTAIGISHLAA